MKTQFFLVISLVLMTVMNSCAREDEMNNKTYNKLTPEEEKVIMGKNTEMPFTGKYDDFFEKGSYHCKRCGALLYMSDDKFESHCGWPSFDDEVKGAVKRIPDRDGVRTEIVCANCGAHLGHVFEGEHLTDKNVRHCVNSISMVFIPAPDSTALKKAYFAGGCFWGVEYLFGNKEGVISAVSGYMGGGKEKPTYQEVCAGNTGHYEAVEVTYDPQKVTYEELTKYFFEIHDPTQANGQGPDIGEQYLSVIFYNDEEEKAIDNKLISILKDKGYHVVTKLIKAGHFWKAEDYHQDYYVKHQKQPYCHAYQKKF